MTTDKRRSFPLPGGLTWWLTGAFLVIGAVTVAIAAQSSDSTRSANGPGDAARGETLFTENCSGCHGSIADGTDSGPPLVHELYLPDHHADFAFTAAVRAGVRSHHWTFGSMPAIPGLSDQDIADIVAHVRGLQRMAGLLEN